MSAGIIFILIYFMWRLSGLTSQPASLRFQIIFSGSSLRIYKFDWADFTRKVSDSVARLGQMHLALYLLLGHNVTVDFRIEMGFEPN